MLKLKETETFLEIAKTITKEEFIEKVKNNCGEYEYNGRKYRITCPSDVGLPEIEELTNNQCECRYIDETNNSCVKCWELATKFIEFKKDTDNISDSEKIKILCDDLNVKMPDTINIITLYNLLVALGNEWYRQTREIEIAFKDTNN